MDAASLSKLLALLASLGVALLCIWLLTRHERRSEPRALLPGYPPGEFASRERITGPLASLCQTQARLIVRFRELPRSHPALSQLLSFLGELRELMDGAYELAALRASPEAQERLERLAREVQLATQQVLESSHDHANSRAWLSGGLEWRLEVLKALARDVDEPRPHQAPE